MPLLGGDVRRRAGCCGRRSTARSASRRGRSPATCAGSTTTLLDRRRPRSTTTPGSCASSDTKVPLERDRGARRPPGPAAARVRRVRGRRPDRRGQEGRRDRAAGADPGSGRGAARGASAAPPPAPTRAARGRAPARRGRELAIAALTAGQLGDLLPVAGRRSGRSLQQVVEERAARTRCALLPHSVTAIVAGRAGCWCSRGCSRCSAPSSRSAASPSRATATGCGSAAALVARSEATVPVGRVRAVRVVEGVFRRPFGLRALTVEVTGYADEASAARTLFPLVRVRDVRAFLDEFLPELADDPRGADAARRRAPRAATCCCRRCSARVVTVGRLVPRRPVRAARAPARRAYGQARWRAAGWRLRDGRLAVRSMRARPHHRPRPGPLPRVAHARPERASSAAPASPTSRSRSARAPRRASATSKTATRMPSGVRM